jgi:uncharacterized protein YerC
VKTGQVYIGKTGKPNPCWRWSEHISDLKNGSSVCPLLQEAWNENSDLTQWQFRALDRVEGKVMANHREAELILEVPDHKRLNTKSTSTVSLARRKEVERMLLEGFRYIDIRDAVGISLGMISKIQKTLQI